MIIDAHAHIGTSWLGWPNSFSNLDDFLQMYNKYSIDQICISSWLMVYDPSTANKDVFNVIRKHPNQIIGLAGISPQCGEKKVQNEIDRCINDYGMKGIKLNPSEGKYYADSFFIEPVIRRAAKYNIPILMHSSDDIFSNPTLIGNIAERFPEVKIIIAHMGGEQWMRAVSICKNNTNVYMDTAGSSVDPWVIPLAVENCGENKVIWGSDFPSSNLASELTKVSEAQINPKVKENILYENAKKIFNL